MVWPLHSLHNENYSWLLSSLCCRATHEATRLVALDIKIFVYFLLCYTHIYRHSHASNTPPSAFGAYELFFFLFFLSSLALRSHSSRMCCVFCLCMCASRVAALLRFRCFRRWRRRRCRRCVFFVAASLSRVVVVCKVVCVQISTLFEGRPLPILRSFSLALTCALALSFNIL